MGPEGGKPATTLSVVVVTYDSIDQIARSLPAIAAELREGDELIVVDNASSDRTPELAAELVPAARVERSPANEGFGAACNRGAALASGELLVFLNPDAEVQPGFRAAIEAPLDPRHPGAGWAAWQALVTAADGTALNSAGGVVHFTGIAWAGGAGRPVAEAPETPREVAFASGACLAIRRSAWERVRGFSPEYFLYHEDTDLGLRLRLAGHRVGIEPGARVDHDYEFAKGPHKWLYLERNRWATVIRTYPAALLLAVLPALLATEGALLVVAALGGWLPQKLRALGQTARELPRLLRERRRIQATRRITAAKFADALVAEPDSDFLGPLSRSALAAALLRGYWRLARRLIGS